MAWNTFSGVCVLLLLCALSKVEASYSCVDTLSSENDTGNFLYDGNCECNGHSRSLIFPGSVFYRLTVYIKRDCEYATVSTYTRPPGGEFTMNITSLEFLHSEEEKISSLPGHDILVVISYNCHHCSVSASGHWLLERVKQSNWIVGTSNSSDNEGSELQICANGGYRVAGSCLCTPGFSGVTCTDACGDDKYGDSCERSCSEEKGKKGRGCRGTTFCDSHKCFCAAGYEGPACDKRCEAGLYGSNCTQLCGSCINGGSCDATTGYCEEGCELGYMPPRCREKMTHLRNAPHIIEVGSTFLKGSFNTGAESTVGRGSVLFFQAQYKIKRNPDSIWVSAPLERYSPDAVKGFQNFTLNNLPPDTDMRVRILLLDEQKRAFTSPPFAFVKTSGRRRVENVKVTSVSARSANFTWDSFDFKLGDYFFVRHECLSLLGCIGPCPHPAGIAIAAGPSIVLEGLLPAAMYRVTVEASDNHKELVTFTTDFLPPDASVSSLRVAALTNSSAILEWSPSAQCEWVFGPTTLYEWSLTPHGSKTGAGVSANTTATATVLTGLQPLTDYQFTVNLFNTEGRSPANRITAVNFSTHHTVPDPPRDLVAYRLNRTAVWLRWREPARPSGTLRAYVVDITPLKGDSLRGPPRLMRSERFPAGTHCAAWPDQVCYTVSRLRPQSRYSITVSAVNEHGDKPGEPASVEASTVKGVSEPPQDLRVVSQGKDFALVAWRLPNQINGDLLFFEVSVVRHVRADEESAETDVPDPDLQRISVSKELPEYQHRVEGLQPGATYSVTVNCGHVGQFSHLEVTTDEDTA